jgi:hypothetical protein
MQMSSTIAAKAPTTIPGRPNPFGHHLVESVVPRATTSATTQAVTVIVMATTAVAAATVIATTSRTASLTWKSLPVVAMQHTH